MAAVASSQFKALSDPALGSVLVAPGTPEKILDILEDLPIRLPQGGAFVLSLRGDTLHIHDVENGVTQFTTAKGATVGAIDVDGDTTTLTVGQSGVNKIVLHRKPGGSVHGATAIEDLRAPVSAMKEFTELSERRSLSPAERVRKAELLQEIQKAFVSAEKKTARSRTPPARSVPVATGESRGGGGYRYSG